MDFHDQHFLNNASNMDLMQFQQKLHEESQKTQKELVNISKKQSHFNLILVVATSIIAFVGILTVWDKMVGSEIGFNLPFVITIIITLLIGVLIGKLINLFKKK